MIDFVTEKFRAAGMLLEKQCLTFQPLHILLSAIEQALRQCSLEASAHARVGAVAFIERFGACSIAHVHFHCVVLDGVFEAAGEDGGRFQ